MNASTDNPAADDAWALLQDNAIDGPWLTDAFNRCGFNGTVDEIDPSLVGTGQVGENVRCRLTWSGPNASSRDDGSERPESVVIKLASSNEASRAAAEATRTYIREVGFYRDVAESVAIRVPQVYALAEDRSANSFVLAMEDMAPATTGDQLAGCSIDQAVLAIDSAADLHGSTWGRTDLVDLDWIDTPTPERTQERIDFFRMLYPGFLDRYRKRLTEAEVAFGTWLVDNFDRWIHTRQDLDADIGTCLVHGDFRLDNMLFGVAESATPLTTVDWQTPSLGNGLGDVAYFLSGSLSPGALSGAESTFLAQYRARLSDHGVSLAEEDARASYRLAAPSGFVMAVIASQLVGQTERGDEMFMVMATGSAAQAQDVDTAGLVD